MNIRHGRLCAVVLILSASLIGCGGKDSDGDGGKKASERLIGTWEMDMEGMLDKVKAAATTDEDKAKIEEGRAAAKAAPTMQIEFTADGKIITTVPGGVRTSKDEGTYEVKSEDGNSLVIHSEQGGKSRDIKLTFVSDDKLEIENPDLGPQLNSMVFKRLK